MKFKYYPYQKQIISDFQLQRDKASYDLLVIKEQFELQKKLILLNEIVNFNAPIVLPRLMPLFIKVDAIDFLIKNQSQIKRKFSIGELIEYGKMYRITTRFAPNIKTLKEMKTKYKNIKPARQHTKANTY